MTEGKGYNSSIRFKWILLCLMETAIVNCPTNEWSLSCQVKVEKLQLLQQLVAEKEIPP